MARYIRVHVEGPTIGSDQTLYGKLDDDVTEDEALQIGQDLINEAYPWGHDVIDESEVPEGER